MTSFTQKIWYDNAAGGTPIQAIDLNRHETALATMATIPTPDMMCHVYWGSSSDMALNGNATTDFQNDTVVYDPYHMRMNNNASFIIPWNGRYSFYTRASFAYSDSGTGYSLYWYNNSLTSMMAWQGTPPIYSGTPVSIYTEEILNAGWQFTPGVFRSTTGTQAMQHFVNASVRTQSIIRYLGPN